MLIILTQKKMLRTVSFASENTSKSKHSNNSSGKPLLKNGQDSHDLEE